MSEIAMRAKNINSSKKLSLKDRFHNYMKEVESFYGRIYSYQYGCYNQEIVNEITRKGMI